MSAIIEIEGLTKRYGSLTALHDLTLSIEEGSIVGFIGPNGAGKTTTIRILTTLLQPTHGEARVAGHSVLHQPQAVRRVMGYMPDFFGVYEDMQVWEYLDFFAACYAIPRHQRQSIIDDLLALVDLGHKREAYVETLSRGMKQRLCLARTLAHDPQVLILDEPASGLDPRARIEIRELLRELRQMGKTIFFSSHILSEVADICDSIAILEAGRLVTFDELHVLQRRLRAHRLIQLRLLGDVTSAAAFLGQQSGVSNLVVGASPANAADASLATDAIHFDFNGDDESLSALVTTLVQGGFRLLSFSEQTGDLEDVFMQLTQGVVN